MNDYVVSYLDFFDNNIVMERIKAPNKAAAALAHSKITGYDYSPEQSFEDLQSDLVNCEIAVEVMEL